jgi:Zn-dependent protease with chaperone function
MSMKIARISVSVATPISGLITIIVGHELGHLRLRHTRLWYQLSTAYVDRVPLLKGFLSRAREYSCDRHGAYLAPQGEEGLVLLAAGRYVYKDVDVGELLEQALRFRGFWPVVAQLPQSHPFTVRRLKVLHDAGFSKHLLRTRRPEVS